MNKSLDEIVEYRGVTDLVISEVLTDKYPAKLTRMGMKDCFGKSGNASALLKYFELTSKEII